MIPDWFDGGSGSYLDLVYRFGPCLVIIESCQCGDGAGHCLSHIQMDSPETQLRAEHTGNYKDENKNMGAKSL